MSEADEVRLRRYIRLCNEFIAAPDLKQFILSNPEVLSEDIHRIFAAIIGRTISQSEGQAKANLDRVKEMADKLQLLRRAIDSGVDLAFLLENPKFQQGRPSSTGNAITPSDQHSYVEVRAEQRGLAGRSFMRNIIGETSLANWEFIGRIASDHLSYPVDYYIVKFQLDYGRAIETARGLDREEAQKALKMIDNMIIRDGWRQIGTGFSWYSYRYIGSTRIVDRIAGH